MNNRNDEGRRDYPSGQGYGRGRESSMAQRGSQYGRGSQYDQEGSERSGRYYGYEDQNRGGRSQAQGQNRTRGEYYGGSQFDERMQSAGWDEDRGNWEYEGGPERFGTSGYSEAGRDQRIRRTSGQSAGQFGGQREAGTYGAGTGDYYGGRQGYGAQGSFGSEYNTYGRQQGFGEGSGYTRSQQGYGQGESSRWQSGESRTRQGSRLYGSESTGSGGRGYMGGQEYLDEGEMSGYGGRELSSQQYGSSSTGRYGTAPGQYGYGGYGMGARGYRGLGPKNYTRSDERLTEEINERLTDDDDLDASEINVRVAEGKVTLEGSVDQRWMKHRAEDIADACSGVKEVDNRIQVSSMSGTLGSSQASSRSGSRTSTGTSAGTTGTTGSTSSTGGTTPH